MFSFLKFISWVMCVGSIIFGITYISAGNTLGIISCIFILVYSIINLCFFSKLDNMEQKIQDLSNYINDLEFKKYIESNSNKNEK